jgi:hypothetical protein
MTKILEIKHCKGCPYREVGDSYSLDGWGRGSDWNCKKKRGKKIAGFVEYPSEEKHIKIPKWCPLPDKEE